MKAIDIGCGYDDCRWLPGADTADGNSEGTTFPQNVSADTPLPVPKGTYDLVWYSYGWYLTHQSERAGIAQEISRICKDRATLFIRDYPIEYEWEEEFPDDDDDMHVDASWYFREREVLAMFEPHGWKLESVYKDVEEASDIGYGAIVIILSRNWG